MISRFQQLLTKKPLALRVVLLYIVIGVSVGMVGNSLRAQQAPVQAYSAAVVSSDATEPAIERGRPVAFTVPRIGLSRTIIPGEYDYSTQNWTLTNDNAQYAVITPELSTKKGQTVIYGHNTYQVLAPMKDLLPGDEVQVTSDEGKTFIYTYVSDRFVEPNDVSVFRERPDSPRIVFMTCDGLFSQTRRLIYFDFMGVV